MIHTHPGVLTVSRVLIIDKKQFSVLTLTLNTCVLVKTRCRQCNDRLIRSFSIPNKNERTYRDAREEDALQFRIINGVAEFRHGCKRSLLHSGML